MIKKLRIKFILLSMSAFFTVVFMIIAGINIINYNGITSKTDKILEILSENNGSFPMGRKGSSGRHLPPNMSPEVPYEARYFSVVINNHSGNIVQVETSRIVSLNTTDAINFAKNVMTNNKTYGFAGHYRYIKSNTGTEIRVVFLDCQREVDQFLLFLFVSIAVSLISLIIVFAIITFFSKKLVRPISESYEKQKRFITDAGHEIKTPLTIINADADVLEMEIGENEWLADIKKQAKKLTSLTNDLVYLSRMAETSASAQAVEFSVSDAVSETASSFQSLAKAHGKTFTCNIQPMLSMKGDEKAIRQLVSILLDNALKYSPSNGIVSLSLEKHSRTLLLSVSNTTVNPVPQESLPLLFDRFYRIDSSRNSQTGGYGIGLSIASAIVTAHNGKIQAASDESYSLKISAAFPNV